MPLELYSIPLERDCGIITFVYKGALLWGMCAPQDSSPDDENPGCFASLCPVQGFVLLALQK